MRRKSKLAGKKSNTWALVAAVLVATFSLLFNHLFRITPEKIDVMRNSVATLKSVSHDLVSGFAASEPHGVQRSPKQVMKDLEQLKPVLDSYFAAYTQHQYGMDDKIAQAGNVVRRASDAIESQTAAIPGERLFQARMAVFQSLFLLAGMQPDEYTPDLEEYANLLLAAPELANSEPLRLLMAYHELRLHADPDEVVLEKLENFSARQRDDAFAIKLYGLAANAMKKYGRRALGQLILRQGMQIYQGHENRSQLVQGLIDFKIEQLANPLR